MFVFVTLGDFRAHPKHVDVIRSAHSGNIPLYDIIYLDTTYCKPSHTFPSQDSIIEQTTFLCKHLNSTYKNRVLFLYGTYLIGKERLFISVSSTLNCSIYANTQKQKILNCCDDDFPNLRSKLTNEKSATNVHVVKMGDLNYDSLSKYKESLGNLNDLDLIVAFRPTGWAFTQNKDRPSPGWFKTLEDQIPNISCTFCSNDGKIVIMSVPYSEHSSFSDLESFCSSIKWKRIIPTVNCESAASRKAMEKHFKSWKQESRSNE